MEKELKDFFLTVANYSLPGNIEKYLESLKNMLGKLRSSKRADIMAWRLSLALEYKVSQGDEGFKTFEELRQPFVMILDQIASGKPLSEVVGFLLIIGFANLIKQQEALGITGFIGGDGSIPKKAFLGEPIEETVSNLIYYYPPPITADREKYHEALLNTVFSLACYFLVYFLVNGQQKNIKKCSFCKRFFLAADTRRCRCYDDQCRKTYERIKKQKQRKNDPVKYI